MPGFGPGYGRLGSSGFNGGYNPNNRGGSGSIFDPMQYQPPINWNYQGTPINIGAMPEFSKTRDYKEPNPWVTGGMGLLGLTGLAGSLFGSDDNPFEFARGTANRFGAMGDDFMNPNNNFVKSQKSMAQGTALTGSQQAYTNMNKQFAANGLQGGNMLAKQGQRQMYRQGLDQANQLGNQAYKDSMSMAQNMYQRELDYNQMYGQGEELKRQSRLGRQSSLADAGAGLFGGSLGLFSSMFG
jgi:hypothetical protein